MHLYRAVQQLAHESAFLQVVKEFKRTIYRPKMAILVSFEPRSPAVLRLSLA